MQPVDYTTLIAACGELQNHWIPARIEQVYQCDRYSLALALRTLERRAWLTVCWHPQGARICLGDPPPRTPDTFTFSDQLRHQLNGYALIGLAAIAPWERVIDLQIAQRPGEDPIWHLYVEVMGKYSNVILTDADNAIVTVAHQVSGQQSSVRTVQTGQLYEKPPALLGQLPDLAEPWERWHERVSLIPGQVQRQLLDSYRGLSPAIAQSLLAQARLDPAQETTSLSRQDWERLFEQWQAWLQKLEGGDFTPGWTARGYTVLGWGIVRPERDVQTLLNRYYGDRLQQQQFQQLHHQLTQKIANLLKKLYQKAKIFQDRLAQSANADLPRQQADLLMANLHQWQPGMSAIALQDFETGAAISIPLSPEKNAIQNAQALYKQHQKLKRAKAAVDPLLEAVQGEIDYLEQIATSLDVLVDSRQGGDGQALGEIREEMIQQGYLSDPNYRPTKNQSPESQPDRYPAPSGSEIWVGKNNRQNDHLTFRVAGDYDLWFHTQESAGSHVLLRLAPGTLPEEQDLQFAADWAAYASRAKNSDRVPVVYTEPKYVYKPKGAKPGMVVYKRERTIWGQPRNILMYLKMRGDGEII